MLLRDRWLLSCVLEDVVSGCVLVVFVFVDGFCCLFDGLFSCPGVSFCEFGADGSVA